MPGFPLSIVDLQAKFPRLFFKVGWWRDRPFAQRQVELRWYLVRRLPERSLLSGEYMLPTGEAVYAAILYYLVRGQRLFERVFVLTDDAPLEEGFRARVLFDRDGLRIHMLASSDTGFGGLGHMLRIASAVRTGR